MSTLFGDDIADGVPFDESPAKPVSKAKAERLANSLPRRTGFDYPGRDPRLMELLACLKEQSEKTDSDALAWTLCAAMWQLELAELEQVAGLVESIIRPRAGWPNPGKEPSCRQVPSTSSPT